MFKVVKVTSKVRGNFTCGLQLCLSYLQWVKTPLHEFENSQPIAVKQDIEFNFDFVSLLKLYYFLSIIKK